MDLSQFQKVTKANTVNFQKRQDFDLIYNTKTERFRFSEEMFERLSLEDNSLIQYNKPEGNDRGVYIHVVPANTGVFLKKHAGKSKGRTFKNTELREALRSFGIDVEKHKYLTVIEVGMVEECPMYQIVPDIERNQRLIIDAQQQPTDKQIDVQAANDAMQEQAEISAEAEAMDVNQQDAEQVSAADFDGNMESL